MRACPHHGNFHSREHAPKIVLTGSHRARALDGALFTTQASDLTENCGSPCHDLAYCENSQCEIRLRQKKPHTHIQERWSAKLEHGHEWSMCYSGKLAEPEKTVRPPQTTIWVKSNMRCNDYLRKACRKLDPGAMTHHYSESGVPNSDEATRNSMRTNTLVRCFERFDKQSWSPWERYMPRESHSNDRQKEVQARRACATAILHCGRARSYCIIWWDSVQSNRAAEYQRGSPSYSS